MKKLLLIASLLLLGAFYNLPAQSHLGAANSKKSICFKSQPSFNKQ